MIFQILCSFYSNHWKMLDHKIWLKNSLHVIFQILCSFYSNHWKMLDHKIWLKNSLHVIFQILCSFYSNHWKMLDHKIWLKNLLHVIFQILCSFYSNHWKMLDHKIFVWYYEIRIQTSYESEFKKTDVNRNCFYLWYQTQCVTLIEIRRNVRNVTLLMTSRENISQINFNLYLIIWYDISIEFGQNEKYWKTEFILYNIEFQYQIIKSLKIKITV